MTEFLIKRVYDAASNDDGYRVLVDRLWPRGVSKYKAKLDDWRKEVAPTSELRKWFGHDPAKYAEFKKRYQKELAGNTVLGDAVSDWKKHSKVTLLYGAHDSEHNQAVVLVGYINK